MQAGTFTFLFTDIEASTRQWEADAPAMSEALARHDEVLRSAVSGAGGEVFKHTGDGICAVFPSAAAGVAGAYAAQIQLAAVSLRVRMAVHSGAAETRGDDYFGPTLNRVARIMGAAWGGQILISGATAELLGDAKPYGTELADLGEHSLADLARPERLFQLRGPRLAAEFPPLRAAASRRCNLPVALTRFVGREHELAELAAILKASRLVSVVGVGGGGKTRLVTEAAARALSDFPDGVFMAELAAVRDPGHVPGAVAAALGAMLGASEELVGQLADYLERRRVLLVLDNCEHVVEAAAALAETLLRHAAGLVVLTTSREPLGVPGEAVWRIPPLRPADALDLLCDRARTSDPGFSPAPADGAALERICARLDGLPLALELAAARLHVLSATEISARLDDRFRLLTGGARTAVDRHRTLRATIDWGYDLLDPPAQALLRRLSVFAGGFDLAGAEAVGGDDAFELLGGLVDRSWVAVEPPGDGPTRYRLIETIRQYAAEKLAETGEAGPVRRSHCEHFRRLAREDDRLINPDLPWLRATRADLDNYRAAMEWSESEGEGAACLDIAAGMGSTFRMVGDRPGEGPAWVRRALAVSAQLPVADRVRALSYLAFTLSTNSWEQADGAVREALEAAHTVSDPRYLAVANLARVQVEVHKGAPFTQLAPVAEEAFRLLLSLDRSVAVWGALNLGWLAVSCEEPDVARRWFEEALRLSVDDRDLVSECHAAAALAPLLASRGEADSAVELAERSVTRARVADLPLLRVMALTRQAETSVLVGTPHGTAVALTESLRILRDTGTRHWVALSMELVAVLAAHRGDYALAARFLGAARAHDRMTGETRRMPAPGAGLAEVRSRQALGEKAYEADRSLGETLAADVALTLALEVLGPLARPDR